MIYADTNVLIALVCPDSTSNSAEAWYEGVTEPVCISSWSVMEFRANMGLRSRKRLLTRAKALAAIKQFDSLVSAHFRLLAPLHEHFIYAGEWLKKPDCSLRSADALHLAIASGSGCRNFVSFDSGLGAAARKLGLPVRILKG